MYVSKCHLYIIHPLIYALCYNIVFHILLPELSVIYLWALQTTK